MSPGDWTGQVRLAPLSRRNPKLNPKAAARLLASADMTGAATKALRPADAHTAEGLLRQLATLWKAPRRISVPSLSRTLGVVGHPWRIELGLCGPL